VRIADGFIGSTWALDFVQYVKRNYKVLSPKEVLNTYNDAAREHVRNSATPEMSEFTKSLVEELKKKPGKLTPKQKENLGKFVHDLKNESVANFWLLWSGESTLRAQADDWFENPAIKLRLLECYGNPAKTKERREALRKQIQGEA